MRKYRKNRMSAFHILSIFLHIACTGRGAYGAWKIPLSNCYKMMRVANNTKVLKFIYLFECQSDTHRDRERERDFPSTG